MRNSKAVFFSWTTHPWYTAYSQTIQFFSANHVDRPTCPVNLVMQALRAAGFHAVHALVVEHGAPLQKILGKDVARSWEGRCGVPKDKVRLSRRQKGTNHHCCHCGQHCTTHTLVIQSHYRRLRFVQLEQAERNDRVSASRVDVRRRSGTLSQME